MKNTLEYTWEGATIAECEYTIGLAIDYQATAATAATHDDPAEGGDTSIEAVRVLSCELVCGPTRAELGLQPLPIDDELQEIWERRFDRKLETDAAFRDMITTYIEEHAAQAEEGAKDAAADFSYDHWSEMAR